MQKEPDRTSRSRDGLAAETSERDLRRSGGCGDLVSDGGMFTRWAGLTLAGSKCGTDDRHIGDVVL
jgi:hypothetical protein